MQYFTYSCAFIVICLKYLSSSELSAPYQTTKEIESAQLGDTQAMDKSKDYFDTCVSKIKRKISRNENTAYVDVRSVLDHAWAETYNESGKIRFAECAIYNNGCGLYVGVEVNIAALISAF